MAKDNGRFKCLENHPSVVLMKLWYNPVQSLFRLAGFHRMGQPEREKARWHLNQGQRFQDVCTQVRLQARHAESTAVPLLVDVGKGRRRRPGPAQQARMMEKTTVQQNGPFGRESAHEGLSGVQPDLRQVAIEPPLPGAFLDGLQQVRRGEDMDGEDIVLPQPEDLALQQGQTGDSVERSDRWRVVFR